ncbi:MAG: hypothetical protein ABJ327_12500 [Litoreibacter sp.]
MARPRTDDEPFLRPKPSGIFEVIWYKKRNRRRKTTGTRCHATAQAMIPNIVLSGTKPSLGAEAQSNPEASYRVVKMKLGSKGKKKDKTTVIFNPRVTMTSHPHYFDTNSHPISPATSDFSLRKGHEYEAGRELCYETEV